MKDLRGAMGQANCAATKTGLIGMTMAVPTQICQTEIQRIPAGRVGSPDDVAGTVLFLASGAADFTTGQVISVNGGQLMP